jgi:hypothetical protein
MEHKQKKHDKKEEIVVLNYDKVLDKFVAAVEKSLTSNKISPHTYTHKSTC